MVSFLISSRCFHVFKLIHGGIGGSIGGSVSGSSNELIGDGIGNSVDTSLSSVPDGSSDSINGVGGCVCNCSSIRIVSISN